MLGSDNERGIRILGLIVHRKRMLALVGSPEPVTPPVRPDSSSLCNLERMSTDNPPGQTVDRSPGDRVVIFRRIDNPNGAEHE